MGIQERPYVGTWQLNNKKVIKHVPDARVYVNGDITLPGCPTCGGRIDIQQYIDQVSCDPSTEGPATASITLHVPKHAGDGLFRDGNFILRPSLEVNIYMRGYFPVKGLTSSIQPQDTGGLDVRNAVMTPYYHVFHGVVTDVNYEYSGGEHRATLSCADILHFWQYQRMCTSGAILANQGSNTKVDTTLVGNIFAGMSPFAITYSLFRDVQGAMGGADYALENKTSAAGSDSKYGDNLFHQSILYWNKRFSQQDMSLRMYGADGTLYNAFAAALLANLGARDASGVSVKLGTIDTIDRASESVKRASVISGLDPYSMSQGASGDKDGASGVDVSALQGFVMDIAQAGTVNLFESQYVTKLEVMNTVKQACGYEFYMDVDGDLVFKPPFYNLDTSASRVYRIEDIDIISFSSAEKEPEATAVKATGGIARNLKIPSLEAEWGVRAEFIDYRLVAQFGWRQQTFESSFSTDSGAMFFSCIARFDLFNIGCKSATATIPVRPELRPGYPVYIAFCDCFYYIHSMSHSVAFGGQCTTTLNLVGKRAKFYAPGVAPDSGVKATVGDIDLGNMHNPSLPLEVIGSDGLPKLQGFPNVVMMIDPTLTNAVTWSTGASVDDLVDSAGKVSTSAINKLIAQVRDTGKLFSPHTDTDGSVSEQAKALTGPFDIQTGPGTYTPVPSTADLAGQVGKLQAAYAKNGNNSISTAQATADGCNELMLLLQASKPPRPKLYPETESDAHYLDLLSDQKTNFGSNNIPGYYRYYSSSHPVASMQGPVTFTVDNTGTVATGSTTPVDENREITATQFVTTSLGENTLVAEQEVFAGIPLIKSGKGANGVSTISTPTHQITTFSLAVFPVDRTNTTQVTQVDPLAVYTGPGLEAAYLRFFQANAGGIQAGLTSIAGTTYKDLFNLIAVDRIQSVIGSLPNFPSASKTVGAFDGIDLQSKIQSVLTEMADVCAETVDSWVLTQTAAKPANSTKVNSGFGPRIPPQSGASSDHLGLDIAGSLGDPIYAANDGTVTTTHGSPIVIHVNDGSGTETLYMHPSAWVADGTVVKKGDQIGAIGTDPHSTGPHLHFEVKLNGKNLDPASWLALFGIASPSPYAKWAATWPPGESPTGGGSPKKTIVAQSAVSNYYVPVFPVSDAQGYEVVGTYRYGRGMSLETLDKMSGQRGFTGQDYDSVEKFLDSIMKQNADYGALVASLDPSVQAVLASNLSAVSSTDTTADITKLNLALKQVQMSGQNFPADTHESTQKSSVVNAAYGLADLGASNSKHSVCSCKGAEADTLLQAFGTTSSFIGVEGDISGDDTQQIQDWLSTQMTDASINWAATQAAYRGTVKDIRSNGITAITTAVAGAVSAVAGAASTLQTRSDATKTADAQLAADADVFATDPTASATNNRT